jgi:DNA repair exonuclease SbcCD ATPase subunit
MSAQELERLLKEQQGTREEVREIREDLRQLSAYLLAPSSAKEGEFSSLETRLEEIAHNLRERIGLVDTALIRLEKRVAESQSSGPVHPSQGGSAAQFETQVVDSPSFEERFEQAQDFSIYNDIDIRIDELKDFLDKRTARWRLHENIFYGLVILLLFLALFFSWWSAFLR